MPPKILNEETRKLSDSDQMIMALFSESGVGDHKADRSEAPSNMGKGTMSEELFENRSSSILDRAKRRFF